MAAADALAATHEQLYGITATAYPARARAVMLLEARSKAMAPSKPTEDAGQDGVP